MAARSIMSHGSETLDVFTRRSQPKIEIELVGQKPGLVNSYTTGDQIEGNVKITVDADTRFDEVEITFQGTSHTTVERAACPGRTGSQQMFLKLRQPIEESDYPCPRIMEAGRTYSFPFTFVVPDRLLPQVCTHARTNIHIHNAHTMLPPTLGDPMLAGNGKTLLDDMAPDMSQISYIVRAAVLKRSSTDHGNLKAMANLAKKVRIIPTVEEEPPINVADHTYYCTHKEKSVKRGFLRGKLGRLVASASQPKPIRLLPPSCETSDTVSTMTSVHLRFDPVGDEQPPKLGSMTSKIKASTFYSAGPWDDFPMHSGSTPISQVGQGLFTESVPISNMCVASAKWVKHVASTECERRDSLQSTTSDDSTGPSTSLSRDTYYTTSVVIPISLPKNKTFVPTFHSCLISRTYSLDLSLTYHTPGANVLTPTVSLRLPIQVITQPKYAESLKSDLGMIVTQEELDEFFQPRSVAPVNESVVDVSLAPPEYSATVISSGLRGLRTAV
ncbi:arrestin (or S-antigen), N-terminal domain protein [Penicillium brasilianum]|uniref:Arrestin (Or S-antigen), N-terminal domain protein n=1 Tax=Penicillium brasilianum TaxID=104259 RepID=A0A1S9RNT4_PENBI|nr:arrestin (or S-antigen), N-terminal domain protein [Penicillium brasilianum]